MPSYKLYYVNYKGMAEKSRLLFALAGQKYEDVRWSRETFQAEKGKLPLGQIPALQVDDKYYSESMAIAAFLAREFGFHGKTNVEQLQVEIVIGIVNDVYRNMYKYFFEKDETKKASLLKELQEQEYPKFIGFFETILKNNNTGYFVGDKIGFADVLVFDTLDKIQSGVDMSGFPLVKANQEKVASNPNIAKWLKERPVTDF